MLTRLIKKNNYFNDPLLKKSCEDENIECACTSNMQNSPVLYAPLKGSQSDLFKSILYNSLEMINPKGYVGMVHPPTPFIEAKGQLLREYLYPRLRYVFQYENYSVKLKLKSHLMYVYMDINKMLLNLHP